MSAPKRLRMLTYNVHRCVGRDGYHSPARIAQVIAQVQADVVALQELDMGRARTQHVDQAALIAEALNMTWFFHPAYRLAEEQFGDAVLSRHPMRLIKAGPLPTLPSHETRGALWVAIEWAGRTVHCLTSHLGLSGRERAAQVETLLGSDWLADPRCDSPRVLLGDLNALPGTGPYRRLRSVLRDACPSISWPLGTFPSACPLLRIDHVLLSSEWVVHGARVIRTRLARVASDHLPLMVEASLN
jgi:endonuclease/exonuclease/phosphatase family metal-dependent hydrolase